MNTNGQKDCKNTKQIATPTNKHIPAVLQNEPEAMSSIFFKNKFLPFIFPFIELAINHNHTFRSDLEDLLLKHLIIGEMTKNNNLVIDDIDFAISTPNKTFLPMGSRFEIIDLELFEMQWDTPISLYDTAQEDNTIDYLFLYVYNTNTNTIECLIMDYELKENTESSHEIIDKAYCDFDTNWKEDTLLIWGLWKRFELNNLSMTESIANSKSHFLGIFHPTISIKSDIECD